IPAWVRTVQLFFIRTRPGLLTGGCKFVPWKGLAYHDGVSYGGRNMPVRLGACLVAEVVGTFALCFVGILSIHSAAGSGAGLVSVALAHGLILSIMVTAAMP